MINNLTNILLILQFIIKIIKIKLQLIQIWAKNLLMEIKLIILKFDIMSNKQKKSHQ